MDVSLVRSHLMQLQDEICGTLEGQEPHARFGGTPSEGPGEALARPRVLANGEVLEKAAVNFTASVGAALPAAATE